MYPKTHPTEGFWIVRINKITNKIFNFHNLICGRLRVKILCLWYSMLDFRLYSRKYRILGFEKIFWSCDFMSKMGPLVDFSALIKCAVISTKFTPILSMGKVPQKRGISQNRWFHRYQRDKSSKRSGIQPNRFDNSGENACWSSAFRKLGTISLWWNINTEIQMYKMKLLRNNLWFRVFKS